MVSDSARHSLELEITHAAEHTAAYITATADFERRDRLWPAHFLVFGTNPMSVAYGACGVSLFLQDALGEVPADVIDWLLDQPVDIATYPPGLYLGLAGVAWSFAEIGLLERAEEVMTLTYDSPLLFVEPNMFLGAAGWGMASLYFYDRTRRQAYLDRAVQAGEYILQSAQPEGETRWWNYNLDDNVHFGFGYGASGIALFLLHLGLATGDHRFLDCATRGLEYDLSKKLENVNGISWNRYKGDSLALPYWLYGSAGVGATVARFYHHLGSERYRALAEEIAESTYIKWSVLPGLLEGISGIGEFMLDMFRFTGNVTYRDRALDIGETILWYRVERPEGTAFPGRWPTRISNDYGTGGAGIGLYLRRLLDPRGRLFLDLNLGRKTSADKSAVRQPGVLAG